MIFTDPLSPNDSSFWEKNAIRNPTRGIANASQRVFVFSSGGVGSMRLLRSL